MSQDLLARIEEIVDERLTLRDYAQYYWQRTKCAIGLHCYIAGWLRGRRACPFCGRVDTGPA